jgi:hypothetical protein
VVGKFDNGVGGIRKQDSWDEGIDESSLGAYPLSACTSDETESVQASLFIGDVV